MFSESTSGIEKGFIVIMDGRSPCNCDNTSNYTELCRVSALSPRYSSPAATCEEILAVGYLQGMHDIYIHARELDTS